MFVCANICTKICISVIFLRKLTLLGGKDYTVWEKFYDSFHMRINDSLLTSSVLQILQVRMVVHEEVFCEDCGASCFS